METKFQLSKDESLRMVAQIFAHPECRDDVFKLVNGTNLVEFNLNNFSTNLLLLAEEYGTETERKTIHRMVKRLKAKYGGISNDQSLQS